jgi:hypothetical protein
MNLTAIGFKCDAIADIALDPVSGKDVHAKGLVFF